MESVMTSREEIERNRQLTLIKEYFGKRRAILDTRTKKFLSLYPYVENGTQINLSRFSNAISSASAVQKKAVCDAYVQEKKYWMSSYVLNNCNVDVHIHIVNTLNEMGKILGAISVSSPQKTFVHVGDVNMDTSKSQKVSPGNNWGKVGEEAVEYVLKWLPDVYCVIEKDCVGKYSDHTILLKNTALSDESQEFDHLVIGPQGVFNIETKNYSGKLYIDRAGNWVRLKKGEAEWIPEENPAQQLFRHHVMLESIIGKAVPIIDVICMSHPALMISGQENSNIPIVKKDLLADFIANYRPAGLSPREIENIKGRINACKISK